MANHEKPTIRDWICRSATKNTPCRLTKGWIEQQGRSYADVLAELESMKEQGWLSYEENAKAQEVVIRMEKQGTEGCEKILDPPPEPKTSWLPG